MIPLSFLWFNYSLSSENFTDKHFQLLVISYPLLQIGSPFHKVQERFIDGSVSGYGVDAPEVQFGSLDRVLPSTRCGGARALCHPPCFPLQSMVGSGSWQRVNAQVGVRSPRYAVFDLAEGKPYVFRVLSANKHGLSEPSEITPPIQAQDTVGE